MLSQRRDLLDQTLDFYEPDVKALQENPVVWYSLLFYMHDGISSAGLTKCQSTEGKKRNKPYSFIFNDNDSDISYE